MKKIALSSNNLFIKCLCFISLII